MNKFTRRTKTGAVTVERKVIKMKKIIKRTMALLFSVMLIISVAIPAFAAFNVNDAASSVLRVLGFQQGIGFGTGSAFVIGQSGGSTYLVTNRHVITDYIYGWDDFGNYGILGIYDFRNDTSIVLDDAFDIRLKASVIILSEDLNDGMDLAILRVDTGLSNRNVLPLAPVSTVQRGDSIFMLGFPGLVDNFFGGDTVLPSTEEYVTIAPGFITNLSIEHGGTKYLQHSAPSAGGASGGPVITDNGAVIGVHAFTMTQAEGYKGAVHIDYIIEQCDRLSIPYVLAGSTQTGNDTDDSPPELPDSPPGTDDSSSFDIGSLLSGYWWVLAVVAGLAIGLYLNHKRTASAKAASQAATPAAVPVQTPMQSPMQSPMQPPMTAGMGHPFASGASSHLICSRGHFAGSTFPINGTLSIGRDPQRCQVVFPRDTKGISSLHCQLRKQGSSITLTDSGSTYGTFLAGGRKLNANESVSLRPGDSFYLADTKNEFKVL